MKIEEHVAKWHIHNTEAENPKSFPGVIMGDEYGYVLHKWKDHDSPKGDFIAVVKISKVEDFDLIFDFHDIQQGETIDGVQIYKYHSNQWRPVSMKKSKWIYQDTKTFKENKSVPNVRRLLK